MLARYGVSINEAMSMFRSYVGADRLIAHNGKRFDSKFIKTAGQFTGVYIRNEQEDSMELAKKVLPCLKKYSLQSLVDYFNVYQRDAHRAQNDVIMLADVVEHLYALRRQQLESMQTRF